MLRSALGVVFCLALGAGVGVAGCKLGEEGEPEPDGGFGRASCLEIRNCVRDKCSGVEADAMCVQSCLAMGDSTAQGRYRNLTSCLVNTCCTASGACGAEPKCGAVGTAECETCTCQAQCGGSKGQPCRFAATLCYGSEPDCSACPK